MKKASVNRMFAYYLLCNIVSNFVHPVTPTFLEMINCPDSMFGIAFSAMAIANFLAATFWGRYGDNFGYAKGTAISCVGYAAGQFVFSQARGPLLVVLGRMLGGAFMSGQAVCVMAYLATATDDHQTRGKYMAVFAAMATIGASIGYLIGGYLGDFFLAAWGTLRPVFYTQIILLLAIVAGGLVLIDEVQPTLSRQRLTMAEINPITAITRSLVGITPALVMFLTITFLTSFATNAQDQSFNYFLRAQLNFPPSYNGIFKAITGIIGLTANLTINIWIAQKTDSRKSIIPVLLMCGVSLVGLILAPSQMIFLAFALVFYVFNAMYLPIQQALVVRNSKSSKGQISGMFNAFKALGMAAGPFYSGLVFAQNPIMPFIAAAGAFLLSTVLCVVNIRQYRKEEAALADGPQ